MVFDYEPTYLPDWEMQREASGWGKSISLWEDLLARVHGSRIDHNWTELVGWEAPRDANASWGTLHVEQREELMGKGADVHQLQSRCASASLALQAVGEIATATVAVWVLEEGPAKTRAEAKERHCRKLHRELAAKQLIGWGQEE